MFLEAGNTKNKTLMFVQLLMRNHELHSQWLAEEKVKAKGVKKRQAMRPSLTFTKVVTLVDLLLKGFRHSLWPKTLVKSPHPQSHLYAV